MKPFSTYCTCTAPPAEPTDIDPPEVKRDKHCPIHGTLANVDPDRARDEQQDNERECLQWKTPR